MFNRTKLFIASIFAMLALATGVNATELRISRTPKLASIQPLLYKTIELLPKYAEKHGIKDLQITLVDAVDGNASAAGVLLGKIDIAVSGANAYVPVWNKDPAKLKLISGWQNFDMWLVCANPSIKNVKDFTDSTKIAMRAINGGHHLQFKEYVAETYGAENATKFDNNIVTIPEDQAIQLMNASTPAVDCAVMSAPWQNDIVRSGKAHIVGKPSGKFAIPSSNVAFATSEWLEKNPELAKAFIEAERAAITAYNADPISAINTYIQNDGINNMKAEDLLSIKKENNDRYTLSLDSAYKMYKVMKDLNLVSGNEGVKPEVFNSSLLKE